TALSAKGLLTVQVSTPPSPLWPLALSFSQLMRFTPRSIADLGQYGYCRHPMYLFIDLAELSMPVVFYGDFEFQIIAPSILLLQSLDQYISIINIRYRY
ncbi:MAG: hypothetical protein ACE5FY_03680, partial [Nitrospiria bacterium]